MSKTFISREKILKQWYEEKETKFLDCKSTSIYLSNKEIEEIPEFFYYPLIKNLDLGNNLLTTLPDIFIEMTTLTILNISRNNFDVIPECIFDITSLNLLDVSDNNLTEMPERLTELISLDSLFMNNNKLTSIIENIGNLVCLREFFYCRNSITDIPDSIINLPSLEVLSCSRNENISLDNIRHLTNMYLLYLNGCNIEEIPEEFSSFSNLINLFLGFNQIKTIPDSLFDNLPNLKYLSLNNNFLSVIPDLSNLCSLERLHIEENELNELPSSLGSLSNLIYINFANNYITALPLSFTKLCNIDYMVCKTQKYGRFDPTKRDDDPNFNIFRHVKKFS
eukprot:TRINITY_DN7267_c0_g2_i1.p1 TRINITY_DN7267_c0_g2~~TRINITY_DN7267_c0_g2_i1.p1  ORF type:complete len:337 (+),score=41.15 TRINITY_DN7267_c0_g2_i1:384-1394(+)